MGNETLEQALQSLRDTLPSVVPGVHTEREVFYSKELTVQIAGHYGEGKSLHAISKMPGMPAYSTLQNWAKYKTEFREALSAMRELRALHFEDAAIEVVESVDDAKDVPAARLKSETYWKAAEVNDPLRYGKKVVHAGDQNNPIQLVVHTGWPEPLNEWQQSPELGPDGLIIRKKPVIEVTPEKKEESNVEPRAPGVEYTGQGSALESASPPAQPGPEYEYRAPELGPRDVVCSSDDVYAERSPTQPGSIQPKTSVGSPEGS